MRSVLTILAVCAIFSAVIFQLQILVSNQAQEKQIDQDLYGTQEAETTGVLSTRLIECSEDRSCPEHAQALFWVAVDILSKASSETIELVGTDIDITPEMSPDKIRDAVAPILDELLILEPGPPKYDFADPEYKRGLELLKQAHDAGSVYASNELGLLFFDSGEMQEVELAEKYFYSAWERGDPNGAYNLARLKRVQAPSRHEEILELLKSAAQADPENLQIMYFLGLEAFGDAQQRSAATKALQWYTSHLPSVRAEFNYQFGLMDSE